MSFSKQKIEARYIGIIDIGTYKIRVGICKILNRDVELIGYGEKRQDQNDIHLQEIMNLTNVCENIKIALEKAETDAEKKVEEVIINIPSSNLFFQSSSYTHQRKSEEPIDEEESYKLLKQIESHIFDEQYKLIHRETGYEKNDLKLIVSNLDEVQIDGKRSENILDTNPKTLYLRSFNIFLSDADYRKKDYISKYIGKDILQIIPSEYALIQLFSTTPDIVMIDIGNTHTSIIVKISGKIVGAKKLAIGIYDLIKVIRSSHKLTKAEIIKKIDSDNFLKEKAEFLDYFEDVITVTLEDIVKADICPHHFFMVGGGANQFVKKYLQTIDFKKHDIKMVKKVEFITPKIDFLDDKVTENPAWIDEVKSNINIFAMIKSTLDFIKKDKNTLERTLKKVVNEVS